MNSRKLSNLLIAACSALYGLAPVAWGQGILAEPGVGGPAQMGTPDISTAMPFTPQTPGLAPGFTLPNMSSYNLPIPAGMRPIQAFTPEAWKQATSTRLGAGTVLTGILEDDLSSAKNNVGDVFSIRLENGFSTADGKMIIPPQSKLLGAIMSVKSAKFQKFGAPGNMEVSLQTLVFPDGRSARVYGFIEHNPAMDLHSKDGSGNPLSGPMHSIKASAISVFSGLNQKTGLPINMPNIRQGLDFKLAKGELIPVRLNRTADLSTMTPPPAVPSTALVPATSFPQVPSPSADGMPPTAPPLGGLSSSLPSLGGMGGGGPIAGSYAGMNSPYNSMAGGVPTAPAIGQSATAGLLPGLAPNEDSRFSLTGPANMTNAPTALPDPF